MVHNGVTVYRRCCTVHMMLSRFASSVCLFKRCHLPLIDHFNYDLCLPSGKWTDSRNSWSQESIRKWVRRKFWRCSSGVNAAWQKREEKKENEPVEPGESDDTWKLLSFAHLLKAFCSHCCCWGRSDFLPQTWTTWKMATGTPSSPAFSQRCPVQLRWGNVVLVSQRSKWLTGDWYWLIIITNILIICHHKHFVLKSCMWK